MPPLFSIAVFGDRGYFAPFFIVFIRFKTQRIWVKKGPIAVFGDRAFFGALFNVSGGYASIFMLFGVLEGSMGLYFSFFGTPFSLKNW